MRVSVFEKICAAQKDLPNHWRFRIYEGFRSLQTQQMEFDQEYARVKQRFPNESHEKLFHETTRLVSPVTNLDGSKNIPPHNTGAAIDIEIIDSQNNLIDMSMAAKDWCIVNPELCLTDCDLISESARHHRKILLDIMQAHGFINYLTEWWHFSYGDRYWAYFTNANYAIYGSADL